MSENKKTKFALNEIDIAALVWVAGFLGIYVGVKLVEIFAAH